MWQFHNPVAIHAGDNSLQRLPELLGQRRAILIAFPEAEALGLCRRVSELLGEQLVAVETDIRPNPDVAWLAPLYERLWAQHADAECIIALGGGSSIDCAKAMLAASPDGKFAELLAHLRGAGPAPAGRQKKLIAIPTTAGTGSEVTPWATIWDQDRGCKHSLHQPWTWPEAAIIDPCLMLSLPLATTLASGLDALSHALEAIWNVHRNPVSASLAVSAARSIVATLPELIAEPGNLALRRQLAVAALQAGLAFSNTKTALAHSLSYGITLSHGTPHGIACAFSLPRILRRALGIDREVDVQLLSIFSASDGETACARLADFLESLGVSTDPARYGIAETDWEPMLQAALAGPRGQNFIKPAGELEKSAHCVV